MRKYTIRLALALFTFLIGVAASAIWMNKPISFKYRLRGEITCFSVAQEKKELRLSIPNESWEPFAFEEINKRTRQARLPALRSVILPAGDLEVRVWAGFGLTELEGFVLKRTSGQWSASHLDDINPRVALHKPSQKELKAPKFGWEVFWQGLVGAGILNLPDASARGCNPLVLDGMSYVVEFNENRTYRTYMYGNPEYAKCDEAGQLIRMINLIGEEFDLQEFKIAE
jgi:hypothetical protein